MCEPSDFSLVVPLRSQLLLNLLALDGRHHRQEFIHDLSALCCGFGRRARPAAQFAVKFDSFGVVAGVDEAHACKLLKSRNGGWGDFGRGIESVSM